MSPPQPEAIPTPVPTFAPDIFDPADGVTALSPLNGGAGQPIKFRVVNIFSGEMMQLQSLTGTAPNFVPGTADVYHLAGIITPAPGQPGYAETVALIGRWTLGVGKEVDVEQDPRFPQDLDGRRMVQVFYTPTDGKLKGEKLLLNRMLIRLGYAVVDINSPTAIDVRAWLNDEEYARKKRLGLNALGITLAQRIPLTSSPTVIRPGSASPTPRRRPGLRPGADGPGATGLTTRSTTTSTTTSAVPGASAQAPAGAASGASGGPPPGGPGGPPPGARGGPPPGARGGPPPGGPGERGVPVRPPH